MSSKMDLSGIDRRIGGLFMVGLPGTALDGETDGFIQKYRPAGLILFSRNIRNPLQLAMLCNDLQDRAMKYHGVPLFLSVDQEGGRVARLGKPFTLFPGNTAIGKDPSPVERALHFARTTAKEMRLVGLNMDLAPVVDVLRGKPEKHLEGRAFGGDPGKVALLGSTVIRELQANGIMAVAKHFPGLGGTTLDPHHQLPTINVPASELERVDLVPFAAAIDSDVSAIMTSHARYPALDADNPATLSKRIIMSVLRERMGFNGLIISDDLEMGAIRKKWGVAGGIAASFAAGADILLVCQDQKRAVEGIELLKENLIRDESLSLRLDQSLARIAAAKTRFLRDWEKASSEEVRSYFGLPADGRG